MEQILAVTPILPGQKTTEKNEIPPRASSEPQREAAPAQQQAGHNDLIDLGQGQAPAQQIAPNDVEAQLASTATSNAQNSSLLDFQNDLEKDLPAPGPGHLNRAGTEESQDVFVDAKD